MKKASALAGLFVLLGAALPVTARLGFPDPSSERGQIMEDVYFQIMVAGLIVFAIVMALLVFILIRFREGGKGRATYEHERDNLKAEMFWTIVPLIIVMWVGVISYNALVELDDIDGSFDRDNALVIDITGSQYAWQAKYQDTGVSVLAAANFDWEKIEPFYVPADTDILFQVTGVDVIHALWVLDVGKVDAVPGQINELPVAGGLPEGLYRTVCAENCQTPGHSYMHATIISVPMDEYVAWSEAKLAGAAAGLEQVLAVSYDGSSITPVGTDLLAKGAHAFVQVLNDGPAGMDFTFRGETLFVPQGGLNTFEFDVTETGDLAVATSGASLTLHAVEAETVHIDLASYSISPEAIELQNGHLYVFEVVNQAPAVHNLYIGMNGADGKTDAMWSTGNLAGDEKDLILVAPLEASTLDTWCAVPGHYGLGMHGSLTVQ